IGSHPLSPLPAIVLPPLIARSPMVLTRGPPPLAGHGPHPLSPSPFGRGGTTEGLSRAQRRSTSGARASHRPAGRAPRGSPLLRFALRGLEGHGSRTRTCWTAPPGP